MSGSASVSVAPAYVEDTSQPPAYFSQPRLNPKIRQAVNTDAPTISAIHTFYAMQGDYVLSSTGQDVANIIKSLHYFHVECRLPYLVATVPLAQLPADGKTQEDGRIGDSQIITTPVSNKPPNLNLSKEEHRADERIVGYSVVQPHCQVETAYWRTAHIFAYVAPRYIHRGIGKMLIEQVIETLEGLVWVPPEARNSDRQTAMKASSPRWTELLAIVPASQRLNKEIGEAEVVQQQESLGFKERGRLINMAQKQGRMLDVWYFQRSLNSILHEDAGPNSEKYKAS